jgi:hypothetical protein
MAIALPLPRPAILRTTLAQRLWLGAVGLAIFITTILAMRLTVAPSQPGEQTLGLDFLSFYTAGAALNEGRPGDLYDLKATQQFQARVGERDGIAVEGRYAPWWNPPFYAVIFRPLANLRFQTALAAWTLVNLLSAGIGCWLMMRMLPVSDSRSHTWLIPTLLLISVPLFLTLTHGQNACTSLMLLTLTVAFWRSEHSFLAGIIGGLLFYKPQLAAVIAIVMTIDLGWRALAGYVMTGFALLATNLVALPGALSAFLQAIPRNLAYVQTQCPYPWDRHATFKAFFRIALQGEGIAPTSALVGWLSVASIVIVALALARVVFTRPNRDRLIAAAIAATPLLMPFYFDYDLLLLAVPVVLFAADWIGNNEHTLADRWLVGSLIALYLGMLFAPDLAERFRFNPLAPLLTVIVFLLLRRAGSTQSHSTSHRSQSDSNCRMPAYS